MKCPILRAGIFARANLSRYFSSDDCFKEECAWWNERFGMCGMTVESYLKGQEDRRHEVKQAMQDRY